VLKAIQVKNSESLCDFKPIRSKVKAKDICHVEEVEVEGRTASLVKVLDGKICFVTLTLPAET
jgi:hypothetical protein